MLSTDSQTYSNPQSLSLDNQTVPAQMQRTFESTLGRSLWQIGFVPTPNFNPLPHQSMTWFDENQDICRHGIVQSVQPAITNPGCTLRLVPHLSLLKNHHRATHHFYLPSANQSHSTYSQELLTQLCQKARYPLSHIHWHIDKTDEKLALGAFWQTRFQSGYDFFMQVIAYQNWYCTLTHPVYRTPNSPTGKHIEHIHFYSYQRAGNKKTSFTPTAELLCIKKNSTPTPVTFTSDKVTQQNENSVQQWIRINQSSLCLSPGEKIILSNHSEKQAFWVLRNSSLSHHNTCYHSLLTNYLPPPNTSQTLVSHAGITGVIQKSTSPGEYHIEIDHASATQNGDTSRAILNNVPHHQHLQNTKHGWHWPLPINQQVYLQFRHADPLQPIITACINNIGTDQPQNTWRCTLKQNLGVISSTSLKTFLKITHQPKTCFLFQDHQHEWLSEGGGINQYAQTYTTQSRIHHIASMMQRYTGNHKHIKTEFSYQQSKNLHSIAVRQQNHHHKIEWLSKNYLQLVIKDWRSQIHKLNFSHQMINLSAHHWHHHAQTRIILGNEKCQIQITPQSIRLMAGHLQANNVNLAGDIQSTASPSPPPTLSPIINSHPSTHPRWLARLAFGHIKHLFWSKSLLIWGQSLSACIEFQAPLPNPQIKLHVFLKNTTRIEPGTNPCIDSISHTVTRWQDLQSIPWSSARCQKTLPRGREIYFQIESQVGLLTQHSNLCHCLQPCQFTLFLSPFPHPVFTPSDLSITLLSKTTPHIHTHTPPTPSQTIFSSTTDNQINITQKTDHGIRHITLLSDKKTHPNDSQKIDIRLSPKTQKNIYALAPPILFNLRHPELNPPFILDKDKNYLKSQKKVCLFIHGFNVEKGEWGHEINNITVTKKVSGKITSVDLSDIKCTYLRRWQTLCQLYPELKQPLHKIDASIDPKKNLNGSGDINWFLHMEDNLHRARESDYHHFCRYERLMHVRWAGNPSFILNYQSAVDKTIPTGKHLAQLIVDLSQLNITIDIIAHSLGCGVVCQALNICGKKYKKPLVRHVFLCNAAVPNNLFTKNANNISPTWFLPNLAQAAKQYHLIYSKHDHILGPLDQQDSIWDKKHWQHRDLWEEYLSALLLKKLHLGSVYLLANHLGVTVHELFNPSDQHIIYQLWRKSNPQDHLPEHFSVYKKNILSLHTHWLKKIKEKFIAFHHDAHKRQIFFHPPKMPHSNLANRLHTWLKQNNPLSSFWSRMGGVCALFLLIKAGDTLRAQPAMGFSGPDTTDPQTAQLLTHHKIQAWCLDNHIHSHSAIKKPSVGLMRELYQKIADRIDQPS